MKKEKIFLLLLFQIVFTILVIGQNKIPSNESLKISIDPIVQGEYLIVEGMVTNLTSVSYNLNYRLTITQKKPIYLRNKQRNKFTLDSMATIGLGRMKVEITPASIFHIKFEVLHDTTLISFIEISNELEKEVITVGKGLVINASKTKNGYDFYEIFNKYWIVSEFQKEVTIRIEELPIRSRTSNISLYVNDNLIARQILRTRYDDIEEQAKNLFDYTLYYIKNNPSIVQELDGDMMGNGLN